MPKRANPSAPSASSSSIPETLLDGLPIPKLFAFDLDYTLWPFWVDAHVSPPFKQILQPDGTSTVQDATRQQWRFYRDVPAILSLLHAHPCKPKIVAASRTPEPEFAKEFLRKLLVLHPHAEHARHPEHQKKLAALGSGSGSDANKKSIPDIPPPPSPTPAYDLFHHMEIYPGSKLTHFKKIYQRFDRGGVSKKDRKRKSQGSSEGARQGEVIGYEDMLFFDDERRNREVERELGVMMILVVDGTTAAVIDEGVRAWRRKRGIVKGEEGEGKTEVMEDDDDDPDAAWY